MTTVCPSSRKRSYDVVALEQVEQLVEQLRRAGPGSVWNGAYHSRSQCVWGTIPTLSGGIRGSAYGAAHVPSSRGRTCSTLDLARTAVFVDFDGTVSEADTGVHLLERLAPDGVARHQRRLRPRRDRQPRVPPRRVGPPAEATSGCCATSPARCPSTPALRRCSTRCAPPVPRSRSCPTASACRADEVAAELGVPLLSNAPDWATGRLEFPHEDRCCACSSCGTCKQAPIKDAHHRGLTTVLIGDGASDCKAALLADVVFAKGALAAWCERSGGPVPPLRAPGGRARGPGVLDRDVTSLACASRSGPTNAHR